MNNNTQVQKIDANVIRRLGYLLVQHGTHVSIRPMTNQELIEWANTRPGLKKGGAPHPNTTLVKTAIAGTIYKNKL